MQESQKVGDQIMSRAPYGARGLKLAVFCLVSLLFGSRPVWGAWIEIVFQGGDLRPDGGRAPYGARGLKYQTQIENFCARVGRAPYGARGLKYCGHPVYGRSVLSRPVWGAWIEILISLSKITF